MSETQNPIAKNPVALIKNYLSNEAVRKRFEEMMGKRAGAFTNSIINLVRNSNQLQKCSPESVISSAIVAGTLNLPIDPAIGQASIVPYGSSAHFQIMYKGLTQLCIRTGLYQTIHCTEIYSDELKSWNPVTGTIKFTDESTWKMRYADKSKNIIGHYAFLKLMSGFEKSDYMKCEEVMAHAKKYSKAYQYDLSAKKQTSAWSTNPVAMGNKTVLIRLLTHYGIMSIEMQTAITSDRNTFEETEAETAKRIDSEAGSEIVDAEFEKPAQIGDEVKKKIEDMKKADKKAKKKRGRPAKNQPKEEPPVTEQQIEPDLSPDGDEGEPPEGEFQYQCAKGHIFDTPTKGGNGVDLCPKCLTNNLKMIEKTDGENPAFLKD